MIDPRRKARIEGNDPLNSPKVRGEFDTSHNLMLNPSFSYR